MRLKKPKSNEKNNQSKIPPKNHRHNKNISMDQISPKTDINQSLYLHKILVKNLGDQTPEENFPFYKENLENFQSSIQNIFSNEENRQKAMKYVINMRNRRGNLSPYEAKEERRLNKNNNNININNINIFSKTINDGFYESPELKSNYFANLPSSKKPAYKSRDKKINQKINFKPYTGYNIYSNQLDHFYPENSLTKEKKNKLYEEYQSNQTGNNINNNMYMPSMTNSNTRGKISNINEISSYKKSNRDNDKRLYYRKKKFSKNENLYFDSKSKSKHNRYRYVEDDNDNDSDLNNYDNNNNININEQSDSDEYDQTFDNNANNNNKLKEIVIDNISDLYQSQKLKEKDIYEDKNRYRNGFDNLEIEKKRLILFGHKKDPRNKFV